MKAILTGWCPKHDRIFERAERCPECGTALVPLESEKTPPRQDEHRENLTTDQDQAASPALPPPSSRLRRRSLVAGAVVGAFLLGLVFPSTEREETLAGESTETRTRTAVERTVETPRGAIQLERVTQVGDRVNARFRTLEGFPDPSRIEDAAFEVRVSSESSGEAAFGLSDVRLESNATGFSIAGLLDAPGNIVELRLVSIQMRAEDKPQWRVNISSIWAPGRGEPTVLRFENESRAVADGTVRLEALLGWSDRLEAVFELRDAGGAPGNRSEILTLEMLVPPTNGHRTRIGSLSLTASGMEQVSARQLIARFEGVPADATAITIRATRLLEFVEGPWTWRLT